MRMILTVILFAPSSVHAARETVVGTVVALADGGAAFTLRPVGAEADALRFVVAKHTAGADRLVAGTKLVVRYDIATRTAIVLAEPVAGEEAEDPVGGDERSARPSRTGRTTASSEQATRVPVEPPSCVTCGNTGAIPCTNTECKAGKVYSFERQQVSADPLGGQRFYATRKVTEACPICHGAALLPCDAHPAWEPDFTDRQLAEHRAAEKSLRSLRFPTTTDSSASRSASSAKKLLREMVDHVGVMKQTGGRRHEALIRYWHETYGAGAFMGVRKMAAAAPNLLPGIGAKQSTPFEAMSLGELWQVYDVPFRKEVPKDSAYHD